MIINKIDIDQLQNIKPTLILLAAGMGSRYGGLKQLDQIGPSGETIIDYTVFDALRSGFGKIVFIIRPVFFDAFKGKITNKFSHLIKCEFVFQPLEINLNGQLVSDRKKPWGTGHAVLVAKDKVNEPFAVANADDFYGLNSFEVMKDFLSNKCEEHKYAMVGFDLEKTISPNGSVSRGICTVSENDLLTQVIERTHIESIGGEIFYIENQNKYRLDKQEKVSMNLWGFHPRFFNELQSSFETFVMENKHNKKAEFYISLVVNELLNIKNHTIQMLPTNSNWFGVTYKADKQMVATKIKKLIAAGFYPDRLWQ